MYFCITWEMFCITLAVYIAFMKYMSTKFNFNPLNFETLASFSWECTQIKIELELLIDVDMILDYESAV